MAPGEWGRRGPELAGGVAAFGLLDDAADVRWDAVRVAALRADVDLDAAAVDQPVAVLRVRKEAVPDAPFAALERIGLAVPAVEIADEAQAGRAGRPFAVPDAGPALVLATVQPEDLVAQAHRAEQPAVPLDLGKLLPVPSPALAQLIGVGREPRVYGDQAGAVGRQC